MDIAYLLKVIWRRKFIILFVTVLAAGLAYAFSLTQPQFYTSTAQYSTGAGSQKVSLAGGTGWAETELSVNNAIATIKSPVVLGMVSYRLLLSDIEKYKDVIKRQKFDGSKQALMDFVYSDSTGRVLSEKIAKQEILDPTKPYEKKIIDALELYGFGYNTLSGNIKISRIPSTDYIDVTYRSADPNVSAAVVNTVGIEYLRFYENLSSQRGRQNADTIGSVMQAQQRKVDSLTELLIEEKKRQGAIKPEDVSASAFQTQNQLESRLTEEKARYNTASATYESLKKQLDILSGNVSNAAGATDEVLRLQAQKRELITKLNQGGNEAEIRPQIDQINRKIAANTTTPTNIRRKEKIDDLNLQLAEQQGIINASSKTINELESQIRNVSGKTNLGAGSEIKLTTLWSSLDIENRQLVQIKDKFFQAQGMLKESLTSNFKQTIVGQPSSFPDPDKRYSNMGLAGTSAFMFSSFLFLLGALLNNKIKTPSYFRRISEMKLLSVVNKINNKRDLPDIQELLSTDGSLNKSNDQFRESMRKLRFGIESSGKRKILFTSLKPDTGKTTMIISIAHTLKLSRKKVLLIDTNFSHNSISQRYAVQTFLEDSARMGMHSDHLRNLITKTDDPHIDVIGCRGGSYTPSEILPKENILGNLEQIFPEYDLFLMEGPAIANHTDSHELIRYVDGVIAVFSADEKITQADKVLINSLEDLGGKMLGAVLNDVNLEDVDA